MSSDFLVINVFVSNYNSQGFIVESEASSAKENVIVMATRLSITTKVFLIANLIQRDLLCLNHFFINCSTN